MAGHWSEKLFRIRMGYMELTGDEFPVYPYYKEANTEYRNLTKIEQRLFDARQNGTISEKKAAQIALAQIQVDFPELLSNDCTHDWQTAEITYDKFLGIRTSPVSIKEYCTKCGAQRVRILE